MPADNFIQFYADETLQQPIALVKKSFISDGQTVVYQCEEEPAQVLILTPHTQQVQILERTGLNQTNPGPNEWGWTGNQLYLGTAPTSDNVIICYSQGKVLFGLETYTLSGRRQFMVKSPFENDRTKIDTIYVKLGPGFGSVQISAVLLSQMFTVSPSAQLSLSLDGNNWIDSVLLASHKKDESTVHRLYAKLVVAQSEQSGTLFPATIVARTKGFRTSLPSPSSYSLVASIPLQHTVWLVAPENDGTVTVHTTRGPVNIDVYNNVLKPKPVKFFRDITPWNNCPDVLIEVVANLKQVANKLQYADFPYFFDKFYMYDKQNEVLIGNINGSDATVELSTGRINFLSSGSFIGLSKGYMIATTGAYTYPQLELVKSQTLIPGETPRATNILDDESFLITSVASYQYTRKIKFDPATQTFTISSYSYATVSTAKPLMPALYPDRSVALWVYYMYNTSNFPNQISYNMPSSSNALSGTFNIDCSYFVGTASNGRIMIFKSNS